MTARRPPRLLVTGFDAFGANAFNPAEAVVRRLVADPPLPAFRGEVLPTRFDAAAPCALAAIAAFRPDVVLMIGLAESRPSLCLERFARNVVASAAADNAGRVAAGLPVVPGGPDVLATTVDVAALCARLAGAVPGVAASDDAGGYVCNHLYYSVLHALSAEGRAVLALFAHVPWTFRPADAAGFCEPPLAAHERAIRHLVAALTEG